jgi:hypothetical protein
LQLSFKLVRQTLVQPLRAKTKAAAHWLMGVQVAPGSRHRTTSGERDTYSTDETTSGDDNCSYRTSKDKEGGRGTLKACVFCFNFMSFIMFFVLIAHISAILVSTDSLSVYPKLTLQNRPCVCPHCPISIQNALSIEDFESSYQQLSRSS